jgi:exodeoxyribonuclease VII large subunit
MSDATVSTNATEVTVSELSNALKRTIEDRFGYVRVRGEVSGWRGPHSSGHCYFALKDASAKIDAVIWKGTYARMRVKPEEGLEVIATGKLTTFPGKSSYQIVVETVEPAGVGALMALLEDRRRKLAAEGLFDAARKQLIPYLPEVIGVVTSPTGAVIRDILHRIADRFPRHVLVWPVRVQGETSAAEVARAIEGFNALPEGGSMPRPSVIIVARGGGSLEDLWGFNEEVVVRAAAGSLIPLVSAVGHETDWTLIDHAADLRAPTPTGAAEMCVPVRSELMANVADLGRRHAGSWLRLLERRRAELRSLVRAFPIGEDLVSVPRQRLDRAGERLGGRVKGLVDDRRLRLGRAATLLARHAPQAELARARERTAGLGKRLAAALTARARLEKQAVSAQLHRLAQIERRRQRCMRAGLDQRHRQLAGVWQLMRSLSHVGVLERGFALVAGPDGHPLRSVAAVSPGMGLTIQLADGRFGAVAEGEAGAKPRPGKPRKMPQGQGSLF